MHVKALCTLRSSSSYTPEGINAKNIWLSLFYYVVYLFSCNPHPHWQQSTSFTANSPKRIHHQTFPPRAEWDTGRMGLWPKKSLPAAFPTEVWREEKRAQENLSLLVPARQKLSGRLTSCCCGWTCNLKKSKGLEISEYSYKVVLMFAIH